VQTLSLVWGFAAFLGMLAGFLWPLAPINWLNLPVAGAGLILGIASLVKTSPPEDAGPIVGVACSALAIFIGVIRLAIANTVV
jgi:hypothetical protein